jgi:hypothetical protein
VRTAVLASSAYEHALPDHQTLYPARPRLLERLNRGLRKTVGGATPPVAAARLSLDDGDKVTTQPNQALQKNTEQASMENQRSVLRWGGLAGILAFIFWIFEMPLYGFVDPFTPDGLKRFTDVRAALGVSTMLMMTIAFLSVALILALYRALRGTNLAFALFGSVLGVIGYIATALGDASTFFAFAPISDLSQAPAATPETRATAALLWQATQGITNTFFFVGSLFLMLCFIILGVAMLSAPAFGRRFGGVSIAFGMIGVVAVVAGLFIAGDTGMQVIGIAVLTDIVFLPLFGWKVYRMSRATEKSRERSGLLRRSS